MAYRKRRARRTARPAPAGTTELTVLVPAATFASAERLRDHAQARTGRTFSIEEVLLSLVDSGLRSLAEELVRSCKLSEPERGELAWALLGAARS